MYININVIIGKKNYQKLLDGIQKMKELHYKVYENRHMILKIMVISIDIL